MRRDEAHAGRRGNRAAPGPAVQVQGVRQPVDGRFTRFHDAPGGALLGQRAGTGLMAKPDASQAVMLTNAD
jgi:hypothetical protein